MKLHRTTNSSKRGPAALSGTQQSLNALKSGAYSAGRLPWESKEAHDKHGAEFVKLYQPVGYVERNEVLNMALNRLKRKRTRLMTTVAMHRHEFGQALLESGAKSWQEVKTFLRQSDVANKETINSIKTSMDRVMEIGVQIEKSYNFDEVIPLVHEIADTCSNSCELLKGIDAKLDRECKFFEQYLPDKLESETRRENALDGQFDKMISRLQVMQEARLRRDALSRKESDAPHRDETDQRSGDGGDRPWRQPSPDEDLDADDVDLDADDVDLDADDAPSGNDPLAEFVEGGSES